MKRFITELVMFLSGNPNDGEIETEPYGKRDLVLLSIVILAFMGVVSSCQGAVDSRFLDAVKRVESGGNSRAVGDNGKSIGAYQIKSIAWREVNQVRVKNRLKTFPYSYAKNESISRLYAAQFLLIQSNRLHKAYGRAPNQAELYSVYNCGFHSFKKRGLKISNAPSSTKKAVQKLNK